MGAHVERDLYEKVIEFNIKQRSLKCGLCSNPNMIADDTETSSSFLGVAWRGPCRGDTRAENTLALGGEDLSATPNVTPPRRNWSDPCHQPAI